MSTHGTYTIKETSQLSGLAESTLRYYETIGIIRPIHRDASSKHRIYSQDDVDIIDAIACLSATGMSIEDMKQYLANRDKGSGAADAEIQLLKAQAGRLSVEAKHLEIRQQYVATKVAYWSAVKDGDSDKVAAIANKARALAQHLKFPSK